VKSNVTLRLDTQLLLEARVLAAKRRTTVSRLLADQLSLLLSGERSYEQAQNRALARLERSQPLGWQRPRTRDELHERG
jgi:hypothetical protein